MNALRLFIAVLALSAGPAAAVPPGFNIQGRLTDSNGVNRDGTFSMKFTLFDAASAGNALWVKTLSAVSVHSGLFQVTLGDPPDTGSVNANIFAALSSDSRYLEIEVLSGTGVSGPEPPLVPRQQLVSNPFAIRAGTVDNASALTSTGVITFTTAGSERMRIDTTGNVGIGTSSPDSALTVNGNLHILPGGQLTFPDGTSLASAASTGGLVSHFASVSLSAGTFGCIFPQQTLTIQPSSFTPPLPSTPTISFVTVGVSSFEEDCGGASAQSSLSSGQGTMLGPGLYSNVATGSQFLFQIQVCGCTAGTSFVVDAYTH